VSPTALMPAYGLAESTLAVTMKPLQNEMRTWRVDSAWFQETGRARELTSDGGAAEHVSCGVPFPGHEIKIAGDDGTVHTDLTEGEICVRGPSVAKAFWDLPRSVAATDSDGWLSTGDLGYLHGGELYVTGRSKDVIIINGRKLHPQTIEWVASEIPGVKRGSVIAFSVPGEIGDEVVVALETSARDHDRLKADVDDAVCRAHALSRVEVLCLPPGHLPKTPSGKVKRATLRREYLRTQTAAV
jgi:fatty-acyl-CoA synthase